VHRDGRESHSVAVSSHAAALGTEAEACAQTRPVIASESASIPQIAAPPATSKMVIASDRAAEDDDFEVDASDDSIGESEPDCRPIASRNLWEGDSSGGTADEQDRHTQSDPDQGDFAPRAEMTVRPLIDRLSASRLRLCGFASAHFRLRWLLQRRKGSVELRAPAAQSDRSDKPEALEVPPENATGQEKLSEGAASLERFIVLVCSVISLTIDLLTVIKFGFHGVGLVFIVFFLLVPATLVGILVVRPPKRLRDAITIAVVATIIVAAVAGLAAAAKKTTTTGPINNGRIIHPVPVHQHGLVIVGRTDLDIKPIAMARSQVDLEILGASHTLEIFDTVDLNSPPIAGPTASDASQIAAYGNVVAVAGNGRGWIDHVTRAGLVQGRTENFGTLPGTVAVTRAATWMANVAWSKIQRYSKSPPISKRLGIPGTATAIAPYRGGVFAAVNDDDSDIGYVIQFDSSGNQVGNWILTGPQRMQVLAAINVVPGLSALAADSRNVVVLSNSNNEIQRINPRTGKTTGKLAIQNPTAIIQAGPSSFYVTSQASRQALLTVGDR
jgi:hypothetical protein